MRVKIYVACLSLFLFFLGDAFAETMLKVGYMPILDHLTLIVSQERDIKSFKELNVELKMFKRWDELVGALDAGVIDAAFILSTLAMDQFNSGMDIKAVLLAHRNGSGITVEKDSEIRSAAGLKGKSIAVPHKKATHVALLDKYLRGENLSLKDVETPVIAPPSMEDAMREKKINAFIVAEPFGAKAVRNNVGRTLVLTKQIIPDHVECIVVVRNQFLQQHSSAIQEWVNSLVRAGKFIENDKRKNSNITAAITKKYMGHDEEVTRDALQKPQDRITFDDLNPKAADFQKIVDIAVRAGIIEKVDLGKFIDDRFYKMVKEK